MIRINDIIDKALKVNPDADIDIINRAYIYSARVHQGQVRLSGEPYLTHPLEVAGILADMNLDSVSIAAGLLHDVIEDAEETQVTPKDLEAMFGKEVAQIVSGVTKLSILPFSSAQARQAESIRKMILAMADDIRVILIKLADRLHNMRTLQYHKIHKRKEIAQETLDIYSPISGRLGIYWIKKELEDIAFMNVNYGEYSKIQSRLNKGRRESEKYIEMVKTLLKKKMEESNLKCEILGRYKHIYSIYQKMVSQSLSFEEIYDVIAFRIILSTIPQCYEALGILHSLWKPIATKFKDYIAVPKPNMYQSLHTTVIGPYGERVEIQIRTWEMDKVAKSGIAAHWSYKEGKKIDEKILKRFSWIQNLVENQENIRDPDEFLENVRIDLFPDEIYVFTPRGQIKSLPKGATPIDFAYVIHSEVGNQCTGAKVNGRMVPLKHELETGNIVEIITTKGHYPSKDWLNYAKTVKAKTKIRQWIKAQEKERSLSLGREMCEKVFRKFRLNFAEQSKSPVMETVAAEFGFKSLEDLIANVGYGKITPLQVIRKFLPKPEAEEDSILTKAIEKGDRKKPKGGVIVRGVDDILVRFAKCCHPVRGDTITGYITRGYGVAVHRTNCINALKMNPERQIDVEWNPEITETFPVKIRVRSLDRVGLLADLAANISKNAANILSAKTETKDDATVTSFFTITVDSTTHLERVIADIRKIKNVQEVTRIDH